MIDFDAALGQEFLDIAIREAEPQIPTHREDGDLGREPVALERRARDYRNQTSMKSEHPPLSLSDTGTTQCNRAVRGGTNPPLGGALPQAAIRSPALGL
jgi:hypothetical protein